MLLILSKRDDEHVPFVTPKLDALGIDYLWFDPALFPSEAQIDLEFDSGGITRRTLYYQERDYDLATVTAVWNRRPGKPEASTAVQDQTHRQFVELVSQHFLEGLWETLDCLWVPAKPVTDKAAHNKLVQLALAAELGFTVYDTLVTNSPGAFLDFYAECNSHLVSKSLVSKDIKRDGEAHVVAYTHPVNRRHAVNFRAVRHAPVIFQAYVPKLAELRVTVVGRRVFAVEIASQESHTTRHDWRHYGDPRVRYRAHTLPHDIKALCLQLVEILGLCFGAIDLILTPEGEYVFLEINPNGQWGFIEIMTNLPIADAMVDLLTSRSAIDNTR